jgi:hypothetical protein
MGSYVRSINDQNFKSMGDVIGIPLSELVWTGDKNSDDSAQLQMARQFFDGLRKLKPYSFGVSMKKLLDWGFFPSERSLRDSFALFEDDIDDQFGLKDNFGLRDRSVCSGKNTLFDSSYLSKCLLLAKLPDPILQAFSKPDALSPTRAQKLHFSMATERSKDQIFCRSVEIAKMKIAGQKFTDKEVFDFLLLGAVATNSSARPPLRTDSYGLQP